MLSEIKTGPKVWHLVRISASSICVFQTSYFFFFFTLVAGPRRSLSLKLTICLVYCRSLSWGELRGVVFLSSLSLSLSLSLSISLFLSHPKMPEGSYDARRARALSKVDASVRFIGLMPVACVLHTFVPVFPLSRVTPLTVGSRLLEPLPLTS